MEGGSRTNVQLIAVISDYGEGVTHQRSAHCSEIWLWRGCDAPTRSSLQWNLTMEGVCRSNGQLIAVKS